MTPATIYWPCMGGDTTNYSCCSVLASIASPSQIGKSSESCIRSALSSHISPHTLVITSQSHTLGFCAAHVQLQRSGALEGCSKNLVAEQCGVEETRGIVAHVHQLAVDTPNKRVQSPETNSKMPERYAPAMAYFLILG